MSKQYKYKTVWYLDTVVGFYWGVGIVAFNSLVLIWYIDMQKNVDNSMVIPGIVLAIVAVFCGFAKMGANIKTRRKRVNLSEAEKLLQ